MFAAPAQNHCLLTCMICWLSPHLSPNKYVCVYIHFYNLIAYEWMYGSLRESTYLHLHANSTFQPFWDWKWRFPKPNFFAQRMECAHLNKKQIQIKVVSYNREFQLSTLNKTHNLRKYLYICKNLSAQYIRVSICTYVNMSIYPTTFYRSAYILFCQMVRHIYNIGMYIMLVGVGKQSMVI